ncbi:hypothetical protein JCM10213_000246 [Rhodosporidiobolus nylandii]
MTRSKHAEPEPPHSRVALMNPGSKKQGGGSANWGTTEDEIREGIQLAADGEFEASHHPQEDPSNHKLAVSSLDEPQLKPSAHA